jgi:hypothetical protein
LILLPQPPKKKESPKLMICPLNNLVAVLQRNNNKTKVGRQLQGKRNLPRKIKLKAKKYYR